MDMDKSPALEKGDFRILRIAVLVIMGIYFFVNFHRSVIPGAIFSTLQSEFNTTGAMISALGAAFMYLYAASQLFVGGFVDKYGGLRLILAGGMVFCIGAMLLPAASSILWMCIFRVMIGIGSGCIYLSMAAAIRRAYPENFPTVLGIALMIGYLGTMTANAPFVLCAERFGWRTTLTGAGIILLVIFLIMGKVIQKAKLPPVNREKISLSLFLEVLKKKCNLLVFFSVSVTFGIFMVIFTVCGKKFLEDFCGMGTVASGTVMTCLGGFSALSSLLSPILCRACGNRRKPFILFIGLGTFIPLCLIVAALLTGFKSWLFIFIMFAVMTVASNLGPIYVSLLSDQNPQNRFGAALSFSNFFAYASVAILGSLTGILMDIYPPEVYEGIKVYGVNSYVTVFGFFALLSAAAVFFTLKIEDIRK